MRRRERYLAVRQLFLVIPEVLNEIEAHPQGVLAIVIHDVHHLAVWLAGDASEVVDEARRLVVVEDVDEVGVTSVGVEDDVLRAAIKPFDLLQALPGEEEATNDVQHGLVRVNVLQAPGWNLGWVLGLRKGKGKKK